MKAREATRRTLGEGHISTIPSFNNLANLFKVKGDFARAEPLLEKVLEGLKRVIGEDHPHTRGTANTLEEVRHNRLSR